MKCINCGHEWDAPYSKVVTCPECGLVAEYVHGARNYDLGMEAEHRGDYREALREFKVAADSSIACAAYAVYRVLGKAEPVDREARSIWLNIAAECDDPIACYEWARSCRKSKKDRMYWLERSSALGHAGASMKLARHFLWHGSMEAYRYYLARASETLRRAAVLLSLSGKQKQRSTPLAADKYMPDVLQIAEAAEQAGCIQLACELYRRRPDDGEAMLRAGVMVLEGRLGEQVTPELAEQLLRRAGYLGKSCAYRILGEAYEEGKGVRADHDIAMGLYRRAGYEGDARASRRLADAYFDGDICPRNVDHAIRWYRTASEQGDPDAAEQIKEIEQALRAVYARAEQKYAEGEHREAVALWQQCADMCHAPSCHRLGICYQKGEGVKQSFGKAARYYEIAAGGGNMAAVYNLGLLCSQNLGIGFDYKYAMELFEKAAKGGYPAAAQSAERLRARRRAKQTHRIYSAACELYHMDKNEESLKHLISASAMGDGKAMYLLGCHAECGDGMSVDGAIAEGFFNKAAQAGYVDRDSRLKRGYLRQLRLRQYRSEMRGGSAK